MRIGVVQFMLSYFAKFDVKFKLILMLNIMFATFDVEFQFLKFDVMFKFIKFDIKFKSDVVKKFVKFLMVICSLMK